MMKILPTAIIHSASTCVAGPSASAGGYVVELRHGENVEPGVPVAVDLCSCCERMSPSEAHKVATQALGVLVPAETRRRIAFANGAEIVTEAELRTRLKVGRTKLWDLVNDGTLPEPMKRGDRNVWLLDECLARYAATELKATK